MIFRSISLFLSFGFAYFHLFIYILPYLTHTRRIEERFVPPIVWDHCDFTATAFPLWLRFHCDCVLHLILRLLAIDLWPIIAFSIEFSVEFLSHFYCITLCTSHRRIAHRDCPLEGFTQTLHILYWFICGVCIDHIPIILTLWTYHRVSASGFCLTEHEALGIGEQVYASTETNIL